MVPIMLFSLAIIILLVFIIGADSADDRYVLTVMLGLFCVSLGFASFAMGKNVCPDIQYVPAEYVAENETSTYFGTEDGNIFYVDRMPLIDRNVPYLLGMDTQGTPDVTDDIILTVWALCE